MADNLIRTFLRASEAEAWKKSPDFWGSCKKVGDFHVELLGDTERGAIINIWEKGKSKFPQIWIPSDDGEWMKSDEVSFRHFEAAKTEFQSLRQLSDVLRLLSIHYYDEERDDTLDKALE